MGEVIQMTDARVSRDVKPKTEAHNYKTHRIILSFNPHATPDMKWQWRVRFTRVYEFAGSSPSLEKSLKLAKSKIDSMIERSERSGTG